MIENSDVLFDGFAPQGATASGYGNAGRIPVVLRIADAGGFADYITLASLPRAGVYLAPTGGSPQAIGGLIPIQNGMVTLYLTPFSNFVGTTSFDYRAVDRRLVTWGDSRMHPELTNRIAALIPDLRISTNGIGGQRVHQIIARQGGDPVELLVAGNMLPSSGGVAVTGVSVAPHSGMPIDLLEGAGGYVSLLGTFGGVPVTLSADSTGNMTLTRLFAGEKLPANRARSIGETIWLADAAALPENFRG